ncbi:MAG: cytochrome C [Methylococcaceae bacterium]|nr:cytochrome C [Methylococcaceae bacterium]
MNPSPKWLARIVLLLGLVTANAAAATGPRLVITQAIRSGNSLTVTGKLSKSPATVVDLYDSSGRPLGQATVDGNRRFSFSKADVDRPELLCSVRAKTGDAAGAAVVKGRAKACAKAPVCKILSPVGTLPAQFDTDVGFKAQAGLKDRSAKPLRMEWDFAGGSMGEAQTSSAELSYRKADGKTAKVRFIRDNTRYRVRFTAWDNQQRYCEDSVTVVVGTPPDVLDAFQDTAQSVKSLAQNSADSAPVAGSARNAPDGGLVVLPSQFLSMQSYTDSWLAPNLHVNIWPFSSVNAVIYRKGLKPEAVGPDQVDLTYAAASNPTDPAGRHSINSTSRNWPASSLMAEALLPKTDRFEVSVPAQPDPDHPSWSFVDSVWGTGVPGLPDLGFGFAAPSAINPKQRNAMPGIGDPYRVNQAQPFDNYDPDRLWFSALSLPVSDIDDVGRINPYPLVRIEAKATDTRTPGAATDAVIDSGRDLHCRGCHEKGGLAADPENNWAVKFYEYGHHALPQHPTTDQPTFYDAPSQRLEDREWAAYLNMASLHDFYEGIGTLSHALGGILHGHTGDPLDYRDSGCANCHAQWQGIAMGFAVNPAVIRQSYGQDELFEGGRTGLRGYDNSAAVHGLHGQLMYNADRTGIRRLPNGRFERWHPEDGPNPAPLFPVKDAEGKPLPQEENCLKCHGGHREPGYRDRMYSAGITCYQCHGDMLAVGGFYRLSAPLADAHDRRIPWFDEPQCGSCHTGNANLGRSKQNGYFSAGVLNLAFEENDPSAAPRRPQVDPDGLRFAVPNTEIALDYNIDRSAQTSAGTELLPPTSYKSLQTPLFRLGKDRHGSVPCASCHGAAHSVWPNRNPAANDNITALQLQGHTGPILECDVCHNADSFRSRDDLDQGTKVPERTDGVLGGPHNLHPVNDPSWWHAAENDTANSDGTTWGGWHNDFATTPGAAGEDQCAPCHGNDHRGTRLSQTPVDRVFDFSDFDWGTLRRAGFRKAVIKVAAGAMIGCDTCHDIKTSCRNSPNPGCGTQEGYVGPVNRPPEFVSTPATEVVVGQPYRATVRVSDPDGDQVNVRIGVNPTPPDGPNAEFQGTLSLDVASGVLSADWSQKDIIQASAWTYILTADDGRNGVTNQSVTVQLKCPNGLFLEDRRCIKIRISSRPQTRGLDAGQTYTYPVQAEHGDGLPLEYSLAEGAPAGMTIDDSGLVTWVAEGFTEESNYGAEIVVRDSLGNEARQSIFGWVCVNSQHYDANKDACVGPITITSIPPGGETYYQVYGMDLGQTLTYQFSATHKQNLPIRFSLTRAPASMQVDAATGTLNWAADAPSVGDHYITLRVSDGVGGLSQQPFFLSVCGPPTHWDSEQGVCLE